MAAKAQFICGCSGIVAISLMAAGMALVGTPASPLTSAVDTAAKFQQNATNILIGSFCIILAAAFTTVFVAGVSGVIRRSESSTKPALTYIQLAVGVAGSILLIPPAIFWSVAAYRPERSPEVIQLLDDLGNFTLYLPYSVSTADFIVVAVAILSNRSSKPVFPRWLAFYTLLAGFSLVPMGLIGFYKAGVFATDGLLAFQLPTYLTIAWSVLMSFYMIRRANVDATSGQLTNNDDLVRPVHSLA